MLSKILLRLKLFPSMFPEGKFALLLISLMLAGQTAYLQTTYTGTDIPATLAADGYMRHNASLGSTVSSAMIISYDNGSSVQAPGAATMSNVKMIVSSSQTDFSTGSFVQADTVDVDAKTVTFHVPSNLVGQYYTLAMSTSADLAIVTVGPASAAPGTTVKYKLEVTNIGPSDVQNAVVRMTGLGNFTVTSISASGMQFSHSTTPTSIAATYPIGTDLKNTGIAIPCIAAFGGVAIVVTGTAGNTENSFIQADATVTMPAGVTDLNPANNASAYSTPIFTPGTLSRYAFDRAATLVEAGGDADPASSNIDAAGNYHFNIVYTLVSGDAPIAPFGTTLKVPATMSAMTNKANGAVNKWRGATINTSNILYIQPYLDQGKPGATPFLPGISLLENLPYVNTQGPVEYPQVAIDPFMYKESNSGYYVPLGIYNLTLGTLPVATDSRVAVMNATTIVSGGGNGNYSSIIYYGYGSHNLGVTTLTGTGGTGSASAPPDTVRPNATYPIVYYGFDSQGTSSYTKDRGYRIDNGMVTFTTLPTPLPLRLLSFTAQKQSNTVQLNWSTAAEVNTQSFEIERSANGKDFVAVGSIAAANSAGNHTYSFIDKSPLNGANIYRLRMTDIDGATTYSPLKSVTFHAKATIMLSPNPTRDVFYINNAPAGSVVKVTDMAGRLLMQKSVSSANEAVDISRYAIGVYMVQLVQNSEWITTLRIVKQ